MAEVDELVLVAGAGGFIGGALTAALLERGHHVRGVDSKSLDLWYQRPTGAELIAGDLRQREVCDQVMRGVGVVYDLAADMGGMGFIETHKVECMLSILIGSHLLLAARDAGVHRFFFSSSACVYNLERQQDAAVTPLREADAYPAMPEDGYGWEKLFMERMCRHFSEDFGMTTRIARYHNVYGPSGTWDGGREKAPAAICRKVAEAQLSGRHEIDIWGDGQQTRSFMYIDDCVDGTQRIMESDYAEPLNLGSSELVTIDQLVDIVERIAGSEKLERHYQLDAPTGVRGRNSDNTLINQVVGWEPSISLETGLRKTYRWIHDQLAAGIKDPDLGLRCGPSGRLGSRLGS